MMTRPEDTFNPSGNGYFQTTHWTEIIAARTVHEDHRREVFQELCVKYWKPVYAYLCRKGCDTEKAKDLTQGFFQDILLEKQLVQQAQQSKGRFRSFLLTALNRYVINEHKYQHAAKRRPKEGFVPLEAFDPSTIEASSASHSPEQAFNYTWASELLRQVYTEVKNACQASGKTIHWQVFDRKVLSPILHGTPSPSMKTLSVELNIKKEESAYNMLNTVKRIFRAKLNNHLRQLVSSDTEIDEEFHELMNIFSRH